MRSSSVRAYPRSRGATTMVRSKARRLSGLSPLTRGNHQQSQVVERGSGPIPAHAGQPPPVALKPRPERAYPRSRGATSRPGQKTRSVRGLSPLTRGNRDNLAVPHAPHGPIPAHAGQPRIDRDCPQRSGAYPRSRGATGAAVAHRSGAAGLSPLTRGNLNRLPPRPVRQGPIPAHAGQPCARSTVATPSTAYPRSRGATDMTSRYRSSSQGLSPLTRGNLTATAYTELTLGPIPAHAGQPPTTWAARARRGAYPRSRGATVREALAHQVGAGLSPLTRGNRAWASPATPGAGPIPAHAGQPRPACESLCLLRAYPRSRGAT